MIIVKKTGYKSMFFQACILIMHVLLCSRTMAQEQTDSSMVITDSLLTDILPPASIDSVFGMPVSVFSYFTDKGLSIDSSSNPALYIAIYPWIGFAYRYGGKGEKGIDCSGFVKRMFADVFSNILLGGGSRHIYERDVIPVHRDSLQEGDLVFFKIRKGVISHVGLYLSNNKFVHASTQAGVIISDLDEDYYRKYYYSAGRVRALIPANPTYDP